MNHAGALVTINSGIGRGEVTVATMQIGLAHAARYHADDHFVGARRAKFQLLQCEGCRTFRNDGGGDLHSKLSKLAGGESIDTASGEACRSAELPSDDGFNGIPEMEPGLEPGIAHLAQFGRSGA